MPAAQHKKRKALVVFFSFSGQTRKLIKAIAKGLEAGGVDVTTEALQPSTPPPFPLPSVLATLTMMVTTLFRARMPIEPLQVPTPGAFDLIVLAGPTWSYNPSGPLLSFFDRDGEAVLAGRRVLPVISCRGYWRLHWITLKRRILRCGGRPMAPWIFTHVVAEPWRTIGVFLTLAGKNPKRLPILKNHYTRYGHSRRQLEEVEHQAKHLAKSLGQATGAHPI